jgi:hypothetical protein
MESRQILFKILRQLIFKMTGRGISGGIAESVPNRTLSRLQERRAWVSEWPKAQLERFCGPNVIAIEGDVLPAKRGDVGEQFIADNLPPGAQFGNGAAEIDGVPEDDGGEGKIEADFPEAKGRTTTWTPNNKVNEMKKLARKGLSKSAIARQLNVGRTSVRRLLAGT